MRRITTYFFVLMLFTACQKEEGPEVSKRFDLDSFSGINFRSIFDVILVPDTSIYAIVTCGENIVNEIKMVYQDDFLIFEKSDKINWNRSYKHIQVELHFKSLHYIWIKSSIKLKSIDTIRVPELALEDNGELSEVDIKVNCNHFKMAVFGENAGIYKVSGQAANCALYLNGSAHFITEYLQADSVYVSHKGIGDCFVNASRVLSGEIILDGLLKYKHYQGLKVDVKNERGIIEPF